MRQKVLLIADDLLLGLFVSGTKHHYEVVDGVPADAKLVFALVRPDGGIELTLQSDSFPEVKEGQLTPHMDVTVKTLPEGGHAA